jgi:hypothetical protein
MNVCSSFTIGYVMQPFTHVALRQRSEISSVHLEGADVFRRIAESPVGHERPETIDHGRTLAELIAS